MNNVAEDHNLRDGKFVFSKALAIGKRILLVEDNAFVRETTSEILESAGLYVLKARNAAAAKSGSGRQIDLLITDVVLPGQNGCQLADDLKKDNPGMKVVFMSGYPKDLIAGNIAGGNDTRYLSKPFSAETLLRLVRQVLDDSGHMPV